LQEGKVTSEGTYSGQYARFRSDHKRAGLPVLKAVVFGQKGPLKEGEIGRTKDYSRELAIKLKREKLKKA